MPPPLQSASAIPVGHADADSVNLQNKVVVVTGANSGLGKEVTTYAAAKGAKVYMLCRNAERAEQAKQDIVQQIQSYDQTTSSTTTDGAPNNLNDNLQIVLVDVAELAQVRKAAQQLQSQENKIDVLVCNAGVLLNDRRESSEGNEMTFASHLLGGTYLLSQLLLPQLKAADCGRTVIVTSAGMYNFKLPSWEKLTSSSSSSSSSPEDYNGVNVYAYAKRAQVLLAERCARDIPDVQWVTAHPGWSDTPAVDEAFGDMKKYLNPLREPWQGAEGIAWLVAADKSAVENGAFYLDRKTQPKHMAGPFFTEGSYTKNSEEEVDELMKNLKKAAGLE